MLLVNEGCPYFDEQCYAGKECPCPGIEEALKELYEEYGYDEDDTRG